jgi:hypothetical protein
MSKADDVKLAFETTKVTVSIPALAAAHNPTITPQRNPRTGIIEQHYTFSDGSTLVVSGRGSNHKMRVLSLEAAAAQRSFDEDHHTNNAEPGRVRSIKHSYAGEGKNHVD